MKKADRKKIIWLIAFSLVLIGFNAFSNSAYISRLIKTIDKTTDVHLLIDGEVVAAYDFEDVVPEFVYGHILDIRKPWNYLSPSLDKKYEKTSIEIHYLKDEKTLGKARVYALRDKDDDYAFFMKNVYYKATDSFKLLLDQVN